MIDFIHGVRHEKNSPARVPKLDDLGTSDLVVVELGNSSTSDLVVIKLGDSGTSDMVVVELDDSGTSGMVMIELGNSSTGDIVVAELGQEEQGWVALRPAPWGHLSGISSLIDANIPKEYTLRAPLPGQRPYNLGYAELSILVDALEVGLCFPLHPTIEECLR
ncbi:hypothetical protein GW17_00058693 [Ensete ventricosum]|nr:hypothetical protein GW17_00058693 [Ensete ventricosum]